LRHKVQLYVAFHVDSATILCMTTHPTVSKARRERRRASRQRILDACHALLEEKSWSEIRLDEVMERAELNRTTFYRHFDDREELLLALLEALGLELELTARPWEDEPDDPRAGKRAALTALTDTFVRHGRVLGAISDAAGNEPTIGELYGELADRLVAGVEERIRADIDAGHTTLADPHEAARALVWLNERYLHATFGRRPFAAEPEVAVATLYEIWTRTLYGQPAAEDATQ
jgi:AcrR family transcriptional regulator